MTPTNTPPIFTDSQALETLPVLIDNLTTELELWAQFGSAYGPSTTVEDMSTFVETIRSTGYNVHEHADSRGVQLTAIIGNLTLTCTCSWHALGLDRSELPAYTPFTAQGA